jgi:hypothetical protein
MKRKRVGTGSPGLGFLGGIDRAILRILKRRGKKGSSSMERRQVNRLLGKRRKRRR